MIFLLLAILSSALVSIVMRLSTGKVRYPIGMLAANYATCLVFALLYTGGQGPLPASPALWETLGLGAVNGVLYLVSFISFQYNVKKNGVVLSSVFMKLGMLVPLVVSIACFGEEPTLLQVLGFGGAIAAILLINRGGDAAGKAAGVHLLLLLLLGGGAEGMSKVFEEIGDGALSAQFLLYTFATALLVCIVCMLFKGQKMQKAEILYGFLIGIPNFFSARFVLRALADIPAMIVYPSFSVATILTVSLVGVAFFGERLRKIQWLAVGVIVFTLIALNV